MTMSQDLMKCSVWGIGCLIVVEFMIPDRPCLAAKCFSRTGYCTWLSGDTYRTRTNPEIQSPRIACSFFSHHFPNTMAGCGI